MSGEDIATIEVTPSNTPPAQMMVWQRDQFASVKSSLASSETMKIEGKPYIKRNGWRMIAAGFSVTLELVKDNEGRVLHTRIEGEDDVGAFYVHTYVARATLPNGRYAECEGACSSRDAFFGKRKGSWKPLSDIDEADIIATAQTVAYNRAISDLVGGAEVSAEEMMGKDSVSFSPKEAYPGSQKPEGKQRSDDIINEKQVKLVSVWLSKAGLGEDERHEVYGYYGVDEPAGMNKTQMNALRNWLEVKNLLVFRKDSNGRELAYSPDEVPPDENPIAQDHPEILEAGEVQ